MEKMGTTQRIETGPSKRFSALTEKYIKAVIEKFREVEPTLEIKIERRGHEVYFIALNQVYRFTNNGSEATVGFAGYI